MNEARTTHPSLPSLPEPTQNRHARPLPPATAELLLVVQGLLIYARYLLDTCGQAAERGFSRIARCFGSAQASFVLTHLTSGILRAIALERVLQAQSAGATDPAAGQPRKSRPPAQRAAPRPPRPSRDRFPGLPTLPQLAAAIRNRPLDFAIDAIRHDLGISFSLWEARFGNALRDMLAAYHGTLSTCFHEVRRRDTAVADAPEPDSAFALPPQKPDAIRYILGCFGAQQPVCGFPFTASPFGAAKPGARPYPEPA